VKSFFARWFLYRVVENVVELNYHCADLVAPVCAYNSRWEEHLGVPQDRIKVIFNGVDPERFYARKQNTSGRARLSSVGYSYPLKGQLDLIEGAAELRSKFNNLGACFYGAPADPEYFIDCVRKGGGLNREDWFNLAG